MSWLRLRPMTPHTYVETATGACHIILTTEAIKDLHAQQQAKTVTPSQILRQFHRLTSSVFVLVSVVSPVGQDHLML